MEAEDYSGDDGGATPVQDERDSGSEEEGEVRDLHSGSETGSIKQRLENEHSDDNPLAATRSNASDSENEEPVNHSSSDSENEEPKPQNSSDFENEDTPREKGSDSENEEPKSPNASDSDDEVLHIHKASGSEDDEPQNNASGSDEEAFPKLVDSDSDNDLPKRPASDSESEDPPNRRRSVSDNKCPSKWSVNKSEKNKNGHASDSDKEIPTKHPLSDSENEDPPSQRASGSGNEGPTKRPANDSDNEGPQKHPLSDSDNEGPPKHPLSDSDNEGPPKQTVIDSENEAPPKRTASDSDSEAPPKQTVIDSDNEAPPKPILLDSENEELRHHQASDSDDEAVSKRKRKIESDEDSDGEVRKGKTVLSQSNHKRRKAQDSDSENDESEAEAPKQQNMSDSDGEEESEKVVKRKSAILSDSEDEEKPPAKKSNILSNGDDSDSDAASEKAVQKPKTVTSDSEDEEGSKRESDKNKEQNLFGSDSESGNEEENLIADIFGESGDEEEEEFTGFNMEDLEGEKSATENQQHAEDSDSDEGIKTGGKNMDFMSDFEVMMQRKKSMSGKKRRNRDGGTFISDADDVVSAMIAKMTEAAEEDRTLNTQRKPALKKLSLLPTVVMHLKKQDLKDTFIDSGAMSAIKEWLSPLPDRSLPALKIREELLKILQELPGVSQETLRHSGIGRAVMYLYKHPKESRPNKDIAGKLINEWSRPIFGLTSNYKGMSREEREQRDLDQMPQRKGLTSAGGQTPRRDLEKVLTGEEKALRPGEPGFCGRARVPLPSNKDYLVRPKWNVEMDSSRGGAGGGGGGKKGLSRLDKSMRKFIDIRKKNRPDHAVKISVQGNKMPL